MGAPSRGGSRSSLSAGARSIARGSLVKTKLPGFEEPETLVPMTRVSASSTAASPLPGSAVRLSRRCCAIPAPGPSSHGSPAAQRVLQGGYRCSGFLLSPFSRGSGTWRFRSAWATGARRGPVRSARPFTVAPERLSSLPTGGDGVRGGRARTLVHGRGWDTRWPGSDPCPQARLQGLSPARRKTFGGAGGGEMRGKAEGCRNGAGMPGQIPRRQWPSGCFPLAGTGGLADGCAQPSPAPPSRAPRAAALRHVVKAGRASGAAAAAER